MPFDPSEWEIVGPAPAQATAFDPSEWEVVGPVQEPSYQQKLGGDQIQNTARAAVGAATQFLPFGEEIVAGGSALVDRALGRTNDIGQGYDRRLAEIRNYQKAVSEEFPVLSGIVNVAGGVALPLPSAMPARLANVKRAGDIARQAKVAGSGLASNAARIARNAQLKTIGQGAVEGAAIGGVYGFAGGEGIEDRIDDAMSGGAMGGAVGGAVPTIGAGLSKFSSAADKSSKALDRASVSARGSDYARSADELRTIELPDGDISSYTRFALDDLLSNDKLGKTRDAPTLLRNLRTGQRRLAKNIDKVIRSADKPVAVPFRATDDLLQKGDLTATKLKSYENELKNLRDEIKNRGDNKLSFLQRQKIAYGRKWDPHDTDANAFNRAIYNDLQKTIEQHVPQVKGLNEELSKYKTVEKIFARNLGFDESQNLIKTGVQLQRTTGGFGVPILAASMLGSPAAGVGLGLLGAAATSPRGLAKLSDAVGSVGRKSATTAAGVNSQAQNLIKGGAALMGDDQVGSPQGVSGNTSSLPTLRSGASQGQGIQPPRLSRIQGQGQRQEEVLSSSRSTIPPAVKQALSQVEPELRDLVAAMVGVESNGNPNARSRAGAQGLMQLMPANSRRLGIDPRDPAQNVRGGVTILKEELDRYQDLALALAAYNAGSPAVNRAIRRAGSTDFEEVKRYLPRETRAYVPRILDRLS